MIYNPLLKKWWGFGRLFYSAIHVTDGLKAPADYCVFL